MIVTTVGNQVYGDEQGSFKEIRLLLNVELGQRSTDLDILNTVTYRLIEPNS